MKNPALSVLSIHFTSALHGNFTEQQHPAFLLTADLIRASGGSLSSSDSGRISASFPNLAVTVLIARRLQWALQGLQDPGLANSGLANSGLANPSLTDSGLEHPAVAATILVHSAVENQEPDPVLSAAVPGQILLSPAAAASVRDLPGFELREAPEGWCELLWQFSAPYLPYATDEQALLTLIRDCGREDPCPPETRTLLIPAAGPSPQAMSGPVARVQPLPSATLASESEPVLDTPQERLPVGLASPNRRWLILGAAAAVLLLVVFVVVLSLQRRGAAPSAAASQQSAPDTAHSSLPSTSPVTTPSTQSATPADHPDEPKPPQKLKPEAGKKPFQATAPENKPVPTGPCDFTEAGISRALSRAETDMHDGHLDEAKAAFLKLRDCASARARADEDLRTVQRKIDAQSLTSPNP